MISFTTMQPTCICAKQHMYLFLVFVKGSVYVLYIVAQGFRYISILRIKTWHQLVPIPIFRVIVFDDMILSVHPYQGSQLSACLGARNFCSLEARILLKLFLGTQRFKKYNQKWFLVVAQSYLTTQQHGLVKMSKFQSKFGGLEQKVGNSDPYWCLWILACLQGANFFEKLCFSLLLHVMKTLCIIDNKYMCYTNLQQLYMQQSVGVG
eukprot:TRINITY_DN5328_c0_g1_i1.p1 TRINITY_DN5328_c0_g1~~TRINITY_DN5328_c0_g1_i1.p1  ORF type:complete len:208 (+),score=-14.70 TRINITY_DN5328_c0_g1_i1:518-1141(+)